jgi:feruloyl esterase
MQLLDATDPDLTRFLIRENGKMIVYHGWADESRQSKPTYDYYQAVVDKTFGGNLAAAKEKIRLFMIPGMGHCRGGPGLNEWDGLPALVDWVEKGTAPDSIAGQRRTDGVVDNRRPVCAFPNQAVYTGPAGGQNDKRNWVERNFSCRPAPVARTAGGVGSR